VGLTSRSIDPVPELSFGGTNSDHSSSLPSAGLTREKVKDIPPVENKQRMLHAWLHAQDVSSQDKIHLKNE
jgi:hypothetical protein